MEDEQPAQTRLSSLVYAFENADVCFAVHVAQHEEPLSNHGLRALVCSFANSIETLDVPLVVMHWVSKPRDERNEEAARYFTKRLELTLADTGTEQQMIQLRKNAEDGARYFADLLSSMVVERRTLEGQVRCGCVEIRYNREEDLINGQEVLIVLGEKARVLDSNMAELVQLCDAHV